MSISAFICSGWVAMKSMLPSMRARSASAAPRAPAGMHCPAGKVLLRPEWHERRVL
jgi:hypothetical protein